jgi:hypothetical protein
LDSGEHIESIELLPVLARIPGGIGNRIRRGISECKDPIHLNSVRIVGTEEQASFFPDGRVGDMLISLRELNAILLLDGETHEVKWHYSADLSGAFRAQHSPRITDHATILLFDNLGSDYENGRSRILEIDIASRKITGSYEGEGDSFFHSGIRGKVNLLGERIIVQEENGKKGREAGMFILDCEGGQLSASCTRMDVFRGPAPLFNFENAAVLNND